MCAADGVTHPLVGDGYCQDETNNADCKYDGGDCCWNSDLVANGYCNDETNNAACMYDGGDCCVNVNTDNCLECQCLGGGVLTYPVYPQYYYELWIDLYWLIQVPIGQTIVMNFGRFNLKYTGDGYSGGSNHTCR